MSQNTTTKSSETKLEQLCKEFNKSEVKSRSGRGGTNLDYISIDSTINRLNSVLGADWSFEETSPIHILDGTAGNVSAVVSGVLKALGKSAYGVGGATGKDIDDVVKTALAEAIKKAGHQFGIGLYLWNEEKREEIAEYRTLANRSTAELQKLVSEKLGETDPKVIAKKLGVSVESLKSKPALLLILDQIS